MLVLLGGHQECREEYSDSQQHVRRDEAPRLCLHLRAEWGWRAESPIKSSSQRCPHTHKGVCMSRARTDAGGMRAMTEGSHQGSSTDCNVGSVKGGVRGGYMGGGGGGVE